MMDIKDISNKRLTEFYRTTFKMRNIELKIEKSYLEDEMKTPIHLYIGQEAIAAGVCANLKRNDCVFSNHRRRGHYIAKRGNLRAMIAE